MKRIYYPNSALFRFELFVYVVLFKIMLWDVRQAKSYLSYFDYNNVRFKRSKDLKFSGESHQE